MKCGKLLCNFNGDLAELNITLEVVDILPPQGLILLGNTVMMRVPNEV